MNCNNCKRNISNVGNCSGSPNTCFLFVDKDLPDENPVEFINNIKRDDNNIQIDINS